MARCVRSPLFFFFCCFFLPLLLDGRAEHLVDVFFSGLISIIFCMDNTSMSVKEYLNLNGVCVVVLLYADRNIFLKMFC